jgi:hypothetical protein
MRDRILREHARIMSYSPKCPEIEGLNGGGAQSIRTLRRLQLHPKESRARIDRQSALHPAAPDRQNPADDQWSYEKPRRERLT